MVFRVIQDKFKAKSGLKYLEDELNRPKPEATRKGVSSIACIVDMDRYANAEVFNELRNDFGLQPNAIQIIGYKRGVDKHTLFSIPFFTDKDLGWNGTIENGDANEFLARDYDVLINYYQEDRLLLKLMSAKTKARIRVGFPEVDHKMNDLIFDTRLDDFATFKIELKKYLKVLNEIE